MNQESQHSAPRPRLTVVIPVFNEEDNLEAVFQELVAELSSLGLSFEVLFVNDASTDRSQEVLDRLQSSDARIRVLRHSINSGESAAQATGFRLAQGELILTMDADGQNNPLDIPALLAALQDGVHCVCGVRSKRNDTLVKQFSSWTANRFRNFLTKDQVADAGCTFRLIRRSALKEMLVFNGMHRFIPTILKLQGYQVVEANVQDRPRASGMSKYGVGNRLWRGILDCLAMRWYAKRALPGERTLQAKPSSGLKAK
ncbi:MAG: glycosyltransferase family 2 protein [Desulfohalobiaceae bacterium]